MKKLFLLMIFVFVLMVQVMANPPINDVDPALIVIESDEDVETSSESSGGTYTKLGWNGVSCEKRDMIGMRYAASKTAPIHPNVKTVILGDYANIPGWEWRARLIPGKYFPVRSKICDVTPIDNSPLSFLWWRDKVNL